MEDIEAVPAYGKDYKTAAEVRQAWNDGKDFRDAASGRYLNKADAAKYLETGTYIRLRYAKLTKVIVVKAGE